MRSNTDHSKQIYAIRKAVGLTQEQFAARLGVTFPTVNRWENQKTIPSPLAMQKLEQLRKELVSQGLEFKLITPIDKQG
jgi:putative transcriptional regulator